MTERRIESALDLFKKYHGRYPRIGMGRLGFREGLTEAGRFYLRPERNGRTLGLEKAHVDYPYVDVNESGLNLQAEFRGETGVSPFVRMQEVFWQRIREEFLDGRRFYIHLYEPLVPRWYGVSMRDRPDFPARFRTWPAIPRGMVINPRGQDKRGFVHWSAFVPEGTPEHDAIAAALELAEFANKDGLKPTQAEIEKLQEALFEKIALVPA